MRVKQAPARQKISSRLLATESVALTVPGPSFRTTSRRRVHAGNRRRSNAGIKSNVNFLISRMHPASRIHTCQVRRKVGILGSRVGIGHPRGFRGMNPTKPAPNTPHGQRHRVTGQSRSNSHPKPIPSAVLPDNGPPPNLSFADSALPVIGTLPDHFAESAALARNSQHSDVRASESHFRATWMLQVAAVVANCNT